MSDKIVFKGETDDHWEMKVRPDGYDPRFSFQITDEDMCGFDVGNDEAVRLAIALIQATPEEVVDEDDDDACGPLDGMDINGFGASKMLEDMKRGKDVGLTCDDLVRFALALIRAAGQK